MNFQGSCLKRVDSAEKTRFCHLSLACDAAAIAGTPQPSFSVRTRATS